MSSRDLFSALHHWIYHTAKQETLPNEGGDVHQKVILQRKGVSQFQKPEACKKPTFESAHQNLENQKRLKLLERAWTLWIVHLNQTTPILDHPNFRPQITVQVRKSHRLYEVQDVEILFGTTPLQWRRGQMSGHHTRRIDLPSFTSAINATLAPLNELQAATHIYGFGSPWNTQSVKRLAAGHDPKSAAIVYTHLKNPKRMLWDNRPEQRELLKMTIFRIENST